MFQRRQVERFLGSGDTSTMYGILDTLPDRFLAPRLGNRDSVLQPSSCSENDRLIYRDLEKFLGGFGITPAPLIFTFLSKSRPQLPGSIARFCLEVCGTSGT